MKFEDFRNITEHSLFELEDDEWIVFHENINDDDVFEVLDENDQVVDELEIIENFGNVSRAISRYNTARKAQFRAMGGANRKVKGGAAFKAQIKGRAKYAANVATFGRAYKAAAKKGKSNFARSFSGSLDNEIRAAAGWSPKKKK